MKVLVTGAAGSIGGALCRYLVDEMHIQVVAFDQAETPLFWLSKECGPGLLPIVGDVCRWSELKKAAEGVTHVVHAAAMKHVGMCEENVSKAIHVNYMGTVNAIEAARVANAAMILVSTDKAVNPTTVMGATKWLAERAVSQQTRNGRIVRLVNIWKSAGSLAEIIEKQKAAGLPVSLSHPDATRFFMAIGDAVEFLWLAIQSEAPDVPRIAIPRSITEKRVADIITEMGATIAPGILRHGEKISEELMTHDEAKASHRKDDAQLVDAKRRKVGITTLHAILLEAGILNDGGAREELFKLVRSHHG